MNKYELMQSDIELLAANLVLPIVKDLILPKIESLTSSPSQNDFDNLENYFEKYLFNKYTKFLTIDTLVFPNKQTLFKILYEPLTVTTAFEPYSQPKDDDKEIKIDNFASEFLPEFLRVVLEDTAGMGKSTISKKLFLSIIEETAGIPILIELRQLNDKNNIISEIQNQLSVENKLIPTDVIINLLNKGDFIFLFDGLDEISKSDRDFVIKDLHKFIEIAGDNLYLITSRLDDSLTSFGDFKKFKIKPLEKEEAFSLIKRYDFYSHKPIADELIKKLDENEEMDEFLMNPFLVSLLYKSFEYKKDIPIKKTQFYRQVFDALFESHDLSKEGYLKREKYSNLHIDDFERVLRYIGYLTSIENKVGYEKDYIINIIDKAKSYTPDIQFKSSDYLKDLLETVPLFKLDGIYYKWAHKSIQDYFAAKFLWIDAKEDQTFILKKIFNELSNKRFLNVLDLFIELDYKSFEKSILLWFLEDVDKYYNEQKLIFNSIDTNRIIKRIENTYNKNLKLLITKKEDYESLRSTRDNDVREYYSNKLPFTGYSQINYHYFKSQEIIVMSYVSITSNIDTILNLLSIRMPDLVNRVSHDIHPKEILTLQEDSIYEYNDDIDNPLNSIEFFDVATELSISNYSLNLKNCLQKLISINQSISKKSINSLTDW